jgi:hypothetical protein
LPLFFSHEYSPSQFPKTSKRNAGAWLLLYLSCVGIDVLGFLFFNVLKILQKDFLRFDFRIVDFRFAKLS